MKNIGQLMSYVLKLKEVDRSGWNKKFPKGSKYKSRSVKKPESVADHSYGTAMLTLFLSPYIKFDKAKAIELALVHDLVESITGDIITTTLSDKNKQESINAKREKELQVIKEISKLEGYGKQIEKLWKELDAGKTREAKIVKQIDQLEMNFQALRYKKSKQKVDAIEFIDSTLDTIKEPKLKELVMSLKEKK